METPIEGVRRDRVQRTPLLELIGDVEAAVELRLSIQEVRNKSSLVWTDKTLVLLGVSPK